MSKDGCFWVGLSNKSPNNLPSALCRRAETFKLCVIWVNVKISSNYPRRVIIREKREKAKAGCMFCAGEESPVMGSVGNTKTRSRNCRSGDGVWDWTWTPCIVFPLPGLVCFGKTLRVLALRILFHPSLSHWSDAELRQKIYHPYWFTRIWIWGTKPPKLHSMSLYQNRVVKEEMQNSYFYGLL